MSHLFFFVFDETKNSQNIRSHSEDHQSRKTIKDEQLQSELWCLAILMDHKFGSAIVGSDNFHLKIDSAKT